MDRRATALDVTHDPKGARHGTTEGTQEKLRLRDLSPDPAKAAPLMLGLRARATARRPVLPPLVWKPSPNHYQGRGGAAVRKIVVHVTVGSYAGAVSWMENPRSQVASHICLREDGLAATQLVRYSDSAWTEAAANSFSVGLEMAGFPDRESDAQLAVAARIVAYLLHRFDLPDRYAPEWGSPGFCRHGDLGVAGGNHPSCPMTVDHFVHRFVPLVQREAARGAFLPKWGN